MLYYLKGILRYGWGVKYYYLLFDNLYVGYWEEGR